MIRNCNHVNCMITKNRKRKSTFYFSILLCSKIRFSDVNSRKFGKNFVLVLKIKNGESVQNKIVLLCFFQARRRKVGYFKSKKEELNFLKNRLSRLSFRMNF